MILRYECNFGRELSLSLDVRFGPRIEIESFEFVDQLPISWRLITVSASGDRVEVTPWKSGKRDRMHPALLGFHDLQIPIPGGTRGTAGTGLCLETRGIGKSLLLVWPRLGTFRE
jgi:hypothetical protein